MSWHISSKQNPTVKQIIKLGKRRERDRSQLFLIEGYRELTRAFEGKQPLKTLFVCEELFLGSNEQALIANLNVPTYTCSESVFKAISYRDRPDGLLAIAPIQHGSLEQLQSKNPFYVVAESIEKPGNLGTILRSSDGAGTNGVIVVDSCTDLFNPNVVRASVGTLFTQPIAEPTQDQLVDWLKANKIQSVAATPSAKKIYTEVDFKGPVAIFVGTEQYGLSDYWMEHADLQVNIPMAGVADSLNVAMATTLLMYEVARQRRYLNN